MSLILPLIGAFGYDAPTGGASGNFTFTLSDSASDTSGGDPASANITGTAGDLFVVVVLGRSGGDHANHVVTDNHAGGGDEITYTKRIGQNNVPGGANDRCDVSVWTAVEKTSPPASRQITADDGTTNNKYECLLAYTPSAAYSWTYDNASVTYSGESSWSGLSISGHSATGDDIFELAIAVARRGSTALSSMAFSAQTDQTFSATGVVNKAAFHAGIEGTSQASGTKGATFTANDTDSEGMIFLLTFED